MRRFLFVVPLFFSASVFAHFSNVIVFGDSLSDNGNFPESSHIWWKPDGKKDVTNLVPQLYVPFSNPINIKLDNPYLAKQPLIENEKNPRAFRSISWSEYFLMSAKQKGLTTSHYIVPSNLLNSEKIPNTISFNYAWGYATSAQQCVNPKYKLIANCNADTIFSARKNYEENPSTTNYLKIEVPGISQQVQLFLNDYRNHKAMVDKNTLYIFWIGGNDLIIAANALEHNANPIPVVQFMMGNTVRHILKSVTLLLQHLPMNQRPAKIYIFTLFNPEFTPGFYNHGAIAAMGSFLVRCYNFWLRWDSKFYNLFSQTKIIIVPIDKIYQENAVNPAFKSQMGKACQLNGHYPGNKSTKACEGFMFWNAVHPSTQMNEIVAQQFQRILDLNNR